MSALVSKADFLFFKQKIFSSPFYLLKLKFSGILLCRKSIWKGLKMLKNALFTKAVCITTMYAFCFAITTRPVMAQARLSPISFNQMYELAHDGDVESLRASNFRGMNIDATDGSGNTGLCLAARRRDVHAYNAFLAAGANPYHPCTQNISGYSEFINRPDVIGGGNTESSSKGAIVANSRNDSRIAPIWWWIGGAAVTGAIVWLLLGGKHGGGSGSDSEAYNSLGRNVAAQGTAVKVTSGTMKNDAVRRHSNTKVKNFVNVDLRNSLVDTTYMDAILYTKGGGSYLNIVDILLETGPGTVAMNAIEKSHITNDGFIKIESYNASVGMVASESSTAVNYANGIIDGSCSDGIAMNFSGYAENDTIVGMYADTASTIYNYGDIKGTAIEASPDPLPTNSDEAETDKSISSASIGTMIGMEAMIINMGSRLSEDTINVSNYERGKIHLSAGDSGTTSSEIKVSLVGIGSYLHNDFLNGSFNLNRAENVSLMNIGEIDLSYSGNYTSSSENALRKGLGGIIGIRADANTNASNQGTIRITLNDEYDVAGVEVAAGMQSVHGGNIKNEGNIRISTPSENKRINYGMVAVEGTGTNSGLYSNINPEIINTSDGKIDIQIGNSYGMASYVGGTLKNEGNIIIGSPETRYNNNIAMYGYGKTKRTDLINTGTIDIYSHKSMAMQNDFAGGTDITNEGIINIHESATDSFVFGGAYSNAYNKGIINYDATATNPGEIAKEGITYDPFKYYSIAIGTSIISSKARTLNTESTDYSSSTTEGIYNEEGAEINMNGSSFVAAMAVEANDGADNTQAKAINNGIINIKDREGENATNAIGMYMDAKTLNNAALINNGIIHTDSNFSAAMVSESERNSDVINNGTIQADHANSTGMYATVYSNMLNTKDILINGKNSIGVYAGIPSENEEEDSDTDTSGGILKPLFVNDEGAKIVVGSEDNYLENSYGVYAQASAPLQIENKGTIDAYTKEAGAAIYTKGSNVKITNSNAVNIYGDKAYGIYTGGQSEVINDKSGVISVGTAEKPTSDSIAIYNKGDNSIITNRGDIHLYNKEDEEENFAIYSTGANTQIKNEQEGNIYLHNGNSTGIYSEHGSVTNNSTINIENDKSTAIKLSGDATALNNTKGIINVGSEDKGVNNSNGLVSLDEATGNIVNKGEINLYNDEEGEGNSHAILAGGNISVTNETSGKINSYNDNSDVIRATGTIKVINKGQIFAQGNNVSVIQGFDEDGKNPSVLTVENTKSGSILIGKKGTSDTEGYGIEANQIASVINRGQITVHNKNSYGIYAKSGESIINDDMGKLYGAKIKMTGSGSTGIYGGKVTNVTNNGIVETFGKDSKAIATSTLDENGEQQEGNQTVTNTGDLILHNANKSYAIYALGDVAIKSTLTGSILMGYDEYSDPVSEDAKNAYGIFAQKASEIINDSLIKIYASGNGITGGEYIANTGNIYLHGNNSNGIYTNGSEVVNSGVISIDGANHSYGIQAVAIGSGETKNVTITNKVGGDITIGTEDIIGSDGHGIYADAATIIDNEAKIKVYARDASGITGGQTIENSGEILISGQNSKGIESNGTEITNDAAISILQAQDSYGIYTNHDTNKPTITNSSLGVITIGTSTDCTAGDLNCAHNGHGIYAENSQNITNYADISVFAQKASGITGGIEIFNYSNNGQSGAIHIVGRDSYGIYGNKDNTRIYNEGKINIDDANGSFGIRADDTAVTAIDNKTSNATITVGTKDADIGTSAHGIYAVKSSNINNEANITIYAQGDPITTVDDSLRFLPLKASGITGGVAITNTGVIYITGGEAHGIYGAVNNTSITNHNNIKIDVANYSYGIRAANTAATTIVNQPINQHDNITIVVGNENETGISSHGIFAPSATQITNNSAISVYAEGANLPASGEDDALELLTQKTSGITGGVAINNYGVIHVTGGKAHGIYGAANNTSINNTNNIKLDVAEFSFGIRAYKTAATSISNTGNNLTIIVGDPDDIGISSHGIFALAANSIINEAAISVYAAGQDFQTTGRDDSPDVLMYKTSGITGGKTITNSGVIYVTGGKAHGIYGNAENTAITNSNRIQIAIAQDSYGIRTSDSAKPTITNVGDNMSIIIGTEGQTDDQTNAHGIYSTGAASITNDADIDIFAKESSGITGGQTIENKGKIHISGSDSKGIESKNATQITNSGKITIDNANNSYGIYTDKSAAVNIINNAGADINIGAIIAGVNGHGIYAEGASSILNNAKITVNSSDASGITGGQSIENNEAIHITGSGSKGIEGANEKTSTITNAGTIIIDNGNNSYGIYTVDEAKPTITNSTTATIVIGTENGTNPYNYVAVTNGHGIYSSNATQITNDANIMVYASGNGGDIFASGITGGETLNNSGSIIVAGNYGHALETHGTKITNNGALTLYGPNGSAGIYSTGASADISNKKTSTKTPNITIGSNAYRGTETSYGIYAEDASKIENDGTIRIYSDKSYGIYSRTNSSQTIENRGDIYMAEDDATGIYTRGNSTIDNKKSITIDIADNAFGINAVGSDTTTSSITNSEDGTILIGKPGTTASNAHGIYLEHGGDIRNDASITVHASNSYGIYNTQGNSITNNGAIKLPQGNNSIGIFSAGKALITNNKKGLITIGSDIPGENSHGIMSTNSQGVKNYADINVYALKNSTAISGGGEIINSGNLYVEGSDSKGINSSDYSGDSSTEGSSSVNNSGKITLPNGNNTYGIYATGNVDISNSNEITVGTKGVDAKNGAAIYTVKGNSVKNTGDLYVYSQNKAWGIFGGVVKQIDNSGKIYMDQKTGVIGIFSGGEVKINNSGEITLKYANKNYGIQSLIGPATITNTTQGIINIGSADTTSANNDKEAYGIYVYNGKTIDNAAEINVYGSESYGIWTDVVDTITNSGAITLPYGQKSGGIYSAQGKNITNSQLGKITIGETTPGMEETGIYAPKSESLNNQADIKLYGQGVAITGHNQIENSGIITIDQTKITDNSKRGSKGIFSVNGDGINNSSTGKIDIYYSNNSIGIDASGKAEIKNDAPIIIGSKENTSTQGIGAYGIRTTDGASIDNSGTIDVNGKKSYGIYSQNSTELKNQGNITLKFGDNSTGIDSLAGGAQITNSGKIRIATATSGADYTKNVGLRSTGSKATITNQENGTIDIGPQNTLKNVTADTKNYGIIANNASSLNNNADITINTDYSYAISATATDKIENFGELVVTGGKGSRGILSSGSAQSGVNIVNERAINLATLETGTGASSSGGIQATNGSANVTNSGTITIGNDNTKYTSNNLLGIAIQAGQITNTTGNITLYGSGIAIEGNAATMITNGGDILIYGAGSTGIHSLSGDITNSGTIKIDGAGNDDYGIDTASEGTITNSGTIDVAQGYGIRAMNYTSIVDNSNVTVIRGKGSAVIGALRVMNQAKGKLVVQGQGLSDYGAVDAKESVTNDGTIGTKNGNAITRASIVTNNDTGIIEVKYNPALGGGPYDLIKYLDGQTGGSVTNSGYMHTEYGAIVRNATSFVNEENSKAIVNGNDGKDLELNPASDATTAPVPTPMFENVTTIVNNGYMKNYNGPIAVGNMTSFTNTQDIHVLAGAGGGVFQGNIGTISNQSNIVKDDSLGAIDGPLVNGNVDTFTNDNGYIHVANAAGVFLGNFGTINNNGGTIINDSGPIISGQNVETINNNGGTMTAGGGQAAIYKAGSITVNNSGTINAAGEDGIRVKIANSDIKVVINNEGGTINATHGIHIIKDYSFVYHRQGDSDVYYWTPDDDKTTINPGTATAYYCWDTTTCMTAEAYDAYVNQGLVVGNHYFEPVYQEHNNSLTGASVSAVTKPVKLSSGKTVNVIMLNNSDIDEEALATTVEKTMKEQETVTAMHNALIWTDDKDLLKNIILTNSGTFNAGGDVHFGDADEESAYISVGKGGTYEADSFAGKLRVEPSVVQGGYDTTYVNKNTLVGENKGVEFVSQSYMFDASSQQNENGSTDVVMTMKPFSETVDDKQISDLLAINYEQKHGEKVFDLLKVANTKNQLYNMTQRELGFRFVPNLAKQSLDIEQTVAQNANKDLLNVSTKEDRVVIDALSYGKSVESKDKVVGYSDQVEAVYGFMDKNYDNGMRLGFGLEAIRSDSSYDDDSGRYNNLIEAFLPVVFNSNDLTALIKPKAGLARGHYRRVSVANVYKAKTKEYYYGVDAAIKQNYNLGWFEIEPQAEFDVTGMYIDDINESNNGLKIKDKNVVSAQSVLSLQAKKKIKLGSNSAVSAGAGGKYIHEFGDNYHAKASVADMVGYYDIISNRITRDYGIFNLKAQFDYRDLSFDASANMPVNDKQKTFYMFNAKYKF